MVGQGVRCGRLSGPSERLDALGMGVVSCYSLVYIEGFWYGGCNPRGAAGGT